MASLSGTPFFVMALSMLKLASLALARMPSRPGEFHPEPLSRVGLRRGPGFE
jgi:hypothetical protein